MADKRRILVFSVDALVTEDVEYLRTKPNFQKYLAGGAEAESIMTVYPSVTYPAHVSMTTGCWPDKTGMISNYRFTTDSKDDTWQWDHGAVKVVDIFDAAKKGGYSTGAVFWPVTGNHPSIDFLINDHSNRVLPLASIMYLGTLYPAFLKHVGNITSFAKGSSVPLTEKIVLNTLVVWSYIATTLSKTTIDPSLTLLVSNGLVCLEYP